jgi:hypothetical protein
MTKAPYNKKLDPDEQISTEEAIAGRVAEMSDGYIEEEVCADIGRDALYIALSKFRPDLVGRQKKDDRPKKVELAQGFCKFLPTSDKRMKKIEKFLENLVPLQIEIIECMPEHWGGALMQFGYLLGWEVLCTDPQWFFLMKTPYVTLDKKAQNKVRDILYGDA